MVVEAQAQAELRLVSVVSVWPHDITHHHPPAHINLTKLFLGNLWSDLSMEEEPDLTDLEIKASFKKIHLHSFFYKEETNPSSLIILLGQPNN